MREIAIPSINWASTPGARVRVPVKVGWPELQLNEAQVVANAVALAAGDPTPFPDPSIFIVVIERPAAPEWRGASAE